MNTEILQPAAILILWTLVILIWMAATRFPAMKRAGINMASRAGGRGQQLEGVIEDRVNWKAHNYVHLLEQPTIFYPAVLILAGVGVVTPLAIGLAWAYVALRIAHSLWQATVNTVPLRFTLFLFSSLCLMALAILAILAVF